MLALCRMSRWCCRNWSCWPVRPCRRGGRRLPRFERICLPTGRWQITYGVVSDSAASSGLYLYMRIGEWFGTMVSPWETRSYLEATTGAGAGQIINTATFVVDSYALHDTMDMLGQANSGGGRSAYSGTMQFMRLR